MRVIDRLSDRELADLRALVDARADLLLAHLGFDPAAHRTGWTPNDEGAHR